MSMIHPYEDKTFVVDGSFRNILIRTEEPNLRKLRNLSTVFVIKGSYFQLLLFFLRVTYPLFSNCKALVIPTTPPPITRMWGTFGVF